MDQRKPIMMLYKGIRQMHWRYRGAELLRVQLIKLDSRTQGVFLSFPHMVHMKGAKTVSQVLFKSIKGKRKKEDETVQGSLWLDTTSKQKENL